jgi:DNA-binding MltR family transcriptional regulator
MSNMSKEANHVDIVSHMIDLAKHTEAGVALVTVGIVEEWLQKLILTAGRPLSNAIAVKIFDGYGPLSTFSAKIEVVYLINLIDDIVYNDLKAIKEIRNKFAHTTTAVFFSSPELSKDLQRLTGWQRDCDPKELFDGRCIYCVKQMEAQIDHRIMADVVMNFHKSDPA